MNNNQQGALLVTNARIYTGHEVIPNGSMFVRDGMIEAIGNSDSFAMETSVYEVFDAHGKTIVPGFIDVHVHGGGGYDATEARLSDDVLNGMSRFHARFGTTSFLPTTLTEDQDNLEATLKSLAEQIKRGTDGAEALGIHLEGPYLNRVRCGAQNPEFIRLPSVDEAARIHELSDGLLRLVTLAPEHQGASSVISYFKKQGITVSIGHSDATHSQVSDAVQLGVTHVTHQFNGMSPFHHREPGVAGAALMIDELAIELICDGIHVAPEVIAFAFRCKPSDKFIIITDAIAAAGCADGEYTVGQLPVIVHQGQATLKETGGLAGSCLTMDRALRNVLAYTGKPLEEVLPAATLNPARQIGVDATKGSLVIGKDADFVCLSEDLQVAATFVRGVNVYQIA